MTPRYESIDQLPEDLRKLNHLDGPQPLASDHKQGTASKAKQVHRHPHQDLIDQIDQLAALHGWVGGGFRTAYSKSGKYMTPVSGTMAGFPDRMYLRPPEVLFIEVKIPPDKLKPEQEQWRDWLRACHLEWACMTPADWSYIVARLK